MTFSANDDSVLTSADGLSTETETTGIALKSIRWITGSLMSVGNSERMELILACASCCAVLMLIPRRNSTTTTDIPSVVVDAIWRTPEIVLSDSSMRLLTSRSTVSGEAPG
jgi:hypothetical protein